MHVISSDSRTVETKKINPIIGIIGILVIIAVELMHDGSPFPTFVVALQGSVLPISLALWWKYDYPLADEVRDLGTHLRVQRRGTVETISLSNIVDVKTTNHNKSTRITLLLRSKSEFGLEISFVPPDEPKFSFSLEHRIATELLERVHASQAPGAA